MYKTKWFIKKETFNLNNVKSVKYGLAPKQIEEKSLNKEARKGIYRDMWFS